MDKGYQPPLDESMVKEFDPEAVQLNGWDWFTNPMFQYRFIPHRSSLFRILWSFLMYICIIGIMGSMNPQPVTRVHVLNVEPYYQSVSRFKTWKGRPPASGFFPRAGHCSRLYIVYRYSNGFQVTRKHQTCFGLIFESLWFLTHISTCGTPNTQYTIMYCFIVGQHVHPRPPLWHLQSLSDGLRNNPKFEFFLPSKKVISTRTYMSITRHFRIWTSARLVPC